MRFLSKFFKRWYLYVLPLIIFPVVAALYAKNTLSVYESTALIFVYQPPADVASGFNGYLSPAINGADAMNQALQIETFCVQVAQGAGLATQYDLTSQVGKNAATARIQSEVSITATTVGQNLVSVTVDDKNPQTAQNIAASFVQEFQKYFADNQASFNQQQIAQYQSQIGSLRGQLVQDQAKLQQYYNAHPQCVNNPDCATTDPVLNGYLAAVNQDTQTITDLTDKVNALKQAADSTSTNAAGLFKTEDAPQPPLHTTLHLKKLIVYPIGGFVAALALILLIVGIQTVADKRVYNTQDLKSLTEDMDLNIPAIESVPVLRGIGRPNTQDEDADGSLNGILVPVLTVLPQLGNGHMTQELRRAIGVTVEGEE
ncbi:MAG TPA: hypothetical protein VKQ30_17140 [Ktedonobacterales bacterium]|nr:hypothetical protein [Ktedonobacterales bacterium]